MDNFNNLENIISLEEADLFSSSKKANNYESKTSNSFFGTIINSISKIGQGLKNIMSMKINYEKEDDLNPNLFNQISNRFNTNEEISLIDAPSFMEESNIEKQNNKKNENNIMMISQNEINNKDLIDNSNNIKNTLNNNKYEMINSEINPNEERKLSIKSKLLNRKRVSDRPLENILATEEEEKNDEENLNI